MPLPFQNLGYLQHGTAVQHAAYQLLTTTKLMQVLHHYSPLLVGTFPLGLQQPGSDLDIICEVYNLGSFEALLREQFGHYAGFELRRTERQGHLCSVATFVVEGWPVEVFGQPVPSAQQQGYRHLVVEHRLLQLGGAVFRARVQAQRATGLKTEPAFAACLGLTGDPYAELLRLESYSDAQLRAQYFVDSNVV
ncbi:DUF4269 domain-containing protein [Hymenobacter sp. GOD-10R]|uniref:DUF4269 domain-containing protein n=1 Tax=Hymenobacter sp. GOD-10R TaxID=3093922 RepID=UPI002D775A6B|nr:DUF4269 domain-containing protein [Hymenobacter sp. GOD-10R]WRQ30361.1 DUF4269 domain-containing protein [Hymenobacter sp. GOD-10R]